MKKTIVSFEKETGITVECIRIPANEHVQLRKEISALGFTFDYIDADSFRASVEKADEKLLQSVEELGYSF